MSDRINNVVKDLASIEAFLRESRLTGDLSTIPQWQMDDFPLPAMNSEVYNNIEMERAGRFLPSLAQIIPQESGPCSVSIHRSEDGRPAYRVMTNAKTPVRQIGALFAR